jgi:phosphoenolpyruvate carboxykinase (GTP)
VETTAAAAGEVGALRFDPFAMLPFCGYHMGDYMQHWLDIGRQGDPDKLPRIFIINWFRKGEDGGFIWPGFGENIRVLDWVMGRCDGEGEVTDTSIGRVPVEGGIDTSGLDLPDGAMEALLTVDDGEVRQQLPQVEEHLKQFEPKLPDEIAAQLEALKERLGDG